MFVLLPRPYPESVENDGRVNFFWAPESTTLPLCTELRSGPCFLEMRLGYPEVDPDKRVIVSGAAVAGGVYDMPLRRGWNSYFVPLTEGSGGEVVLSFSKPLPVSGDSRFLGAMVSYLAVTDDAARVQAIISVSAQIAAAAARLGEFGSKAEWAAWLHASVMSNADDFYAERVLPPARDEDLLHPLNQYLIECKRERWIGRKIPSGATVLDIGCGEGAHGYLSRRGVKVLGLDLSRENCEKAKSRGYADCFQGSATNIPLPDASVDFVISADVLGHIERHEKERCVQEFFRVLKPGGQTIHLIETDDFDPAKMEADDYARMVLIDGHIGIETREFSEKLFSRYFDIVESFLVGNASMSAKHWLRAHDFYGDNLPGELVAALTNASPEEERYFNLGTGWAFWRGTEAGMTSRGTGGLLFLCAGKKPV